MRKILMVLPLILASALPALAERQKIAAFGDWVLYTDDAYDYATRNGKHFTLHGACVAEVKNVQATLNLVALPASVNDSDAKIAGQVLLQVSQNAWNYSPMQGVIVLEGDGVKVRFDHAFFQGKSIWASLGKGANKVAEMGKAVIRWEGRIAVSDVQETALADFSGNGLGRIFRELKSCAGLSE